MKLKDLRWRIGFHQIKINVSRRIDIGGNFLQKQKGGRVEPRAVQTISTIKRYLCLWTEKVPLDILGMLQLCKTNIRGEDLLSSTLYHFYPCCSFFFSYFLLVLDFSLCKSDDVMQTMKT